MVSFPDEGFDRSSCISLLDEIASRISRQQFDTWFRMTPMRLVKPNRIVLTVPNRFSKTWIERKFAETIASSARSIFGFDPVIEVDVQADPRSVSSRIVPPRTEIPIIDRSTEVPAHPESPPSSAQESSETPPATIDECLPSVPINRDFTFSTFVIGPSNRLAHAAALSITDSPGRSYNPLFIYGGVGLGKTHLLHAIIHRLRESSRLKAVCLTSEAFLNEMTLAGEKGEIDKFRRLLRNTDVLIVDDIQFIGRKDRTQEEFFHTFNALVSESKQVILSSDCPPREIPGLKERLVSRFKMGLVTRIDPPDFGTRVAIIHRKARARGKEIPEPVAEYLSNHIHTNIREIEGAITRLFSLASMGKSPDDPEVPPITLDLARTALKEIVREDTFQSAVAISEIQKAVSLFYDVKIGELLSKRRNRTVSFARQVCMYLSRNLTHCSLEEIGAFLGGRNHATVLYSIRKIESFMKKDPRVDADLKVVTNRILASRNVL
jgi:chromosomal replication initiator protein